MATVQLNFKIAAIGPSDVQAELAALEPVIRNLSREFSSRNVALSFHHWSQLAPGVGKPQEYIDQNLNWDDVDFVIGAMWKRFGSPVANADSGTEHECNKILNLSKRGQPDLLFYFRETPDTATSPDAAKIQAFRDALQRRGLVGTYSDPKAFAAQVEVAIRSKVESKLLSQRQSQRRMGQLPVNRSPHGGNDHLQ
jgi:hypothetical protein